MVDSPLHPGDRVALLSPAWAAPAYFPALHEQAVERIERLLGVTVVEFPTTRKMGASPAERAADVNAAFADRSIRAILTTVGGDDEIRLIPHLNPALPLQDPKPFIGYSDNTNILGWLWSLGIAGYYGGASMVHFTGPSVDSEQVETLRGALFGGGTRELTAPASSQDFGLDWSDPAALTEEPPRGASMPLQFFGSGRVSGPTWGGCLEVLDQMALAGRLPDAELLEGAILIFETSEILPPPEYVGRWLRAMGERGYFEAAAGLLFARPVVDDRDQPAPATVLRRRIEAYIDYLVANVAPYRSDLPTCIGVPFGHTRPQYVIPYSGHVTIDCDAERVFAHY
ncbi:S66 family peptidase [Neoactinobaculum massilliense]|uniref:S66 family peptidase n=1 Tax=Neoactinobaculum massilliense TaxID=2364794 RepID=UPI000F51B372|nr:S66 peptidase family protein [Neoactinobaculum massilliense]